MVLIRNLLFMLALAVLTPLYALIAMASFPFGPKTRHRIIRGWPHLMAWVVKHVLGIPYRLVGAENIPAGPAIVLTLGGLYVASMLVGPLGPVITRLRPRWHFEH